MDKVMKTWDRAIDTLNNNIQSMEKELKAPIEQKAVHSIASEIRAHFKGLGTPGERMGAIRRAIDQDDAVTASSVLGTRSYLSGFDDEIHDTFVREWKEKQMPLEAKRVRAMRAAADLLNDRVNILKKEWTEAVGTIKITKQVRHGDTTTTKVVREITPSQVREMVRNANLPFAVPVG